MYRLIDSFFFFLSVEMPDRDAMQSDVDDQVIFLIASQFYKSTSRRIQQSVSGVCVCVRSSVPFRVRFLIFAIFLITFVEYRACLLVAYTITLVCGVSV